MPAFIRLANIATAALVFSIAACANADQAARRCCEQQHDSQHPHRQTDHRVSWKKGDANAHSLMQVKLLGVNDLHGAIEGRTVSDRPAGGADVLAAYFAAESEEVSGNAILVLAGDQVGASPPASALLQDEPTIEALNLMGNRFCSKQRGRPSHSQSTTRCNVVATIGNHEFDRGVSEMLRLINGGNHADGPFLENPWGGAEFPYISANVVEAETGHPILPPFTVVKMQGIKVGFIGATLRETPSIVTPSGVAGVEFVDEAEAINRYARILKSRGVKTIVAVIHQGTRQASFSGETAQETAPLDGAIGEIVRKLDKEIDVVITGHAHGFTNQLVATESGSIVLVTQAYSAATAYADITLGINRRTGDVVEKSAEVATTWADEGPGLIPDQQVAGLVADAVETVAPFVSEVVADAAGALTRSESSAGESRLGNLIADAQRSAMDTDMAFMNPGGIRTDLDAGEITWGELFAVQPFANDLVRMELTGEQILSLLNQQWSGANASSPRIMKTSGIEYTWDASLSAGNRVVADSVLVNGAPLLSDSVYTVTVNSFLAAGGDNFTVLTSGTNRVVGPVDLDALITYMQNQPQPVTAEIEGRITRRN